MGAQKVLFSKKGGFGGGFPRGLRERMRFQTFYVVFAGAVLNTCYSHKMQITIRRLYKNEQVEVYELPKAKFVHRGKLLFSLDGVEEGDWILEVPHTNCAW